MPKEYLNLDSEISKRLIGSQFNPPDDPVFSRAADSIIKKIEVKDIVVVAGDVELGDVIEHPLRKVKEWGDDFINDSPNSVDFYDKKFTSTHTRTVRSTLNTVSTTTSKRDIGGELSIEYGKLADSDSLTHQLKVDEELHEEEVFREEKAESLKLTCPPYHRASVAFRKEISEAGADFSGTFIIDATVRVFHESHVSAFRVTGWWPTEYSLSLLLPEFADRTFPVSGHLMHISRSFLETEFRTKPLPGHGGDDAVLVADDGKEYSIEELLQMAQTN